MAFLGSQYDIFEAAKVNNLRVVRDLLDSGVDVNLRDPDTGGTALQFACSNGAKQTIELLVSRGADLDAKNDRGLTPLHTLMTKRYDTLGFWLIGRGADPTIPDRDGFTARDMCLPWVQKEMDAAVLQARTAATTPQPTAAPTTSTTTTTSTASPAKAEPTGIAAAKPIGTMRLAEEIMKIYLTNGAYKSVIVKPGDTAADLAKTMAEKLNMDKDAANQLDVYEEIKGQPRRLGMNDLLLEVKFKWPTIFGQSGNETLLHCRFAVRPKASAKPDVVAKYNAALK